MCERKAIDFLMLGNHEYISAGEGYFVELVNKNVLGTTQHPQDHSFFCLESNALKVQILGLDTGYLCENFTLPLASEKMDYTTSICPAEAIWAKQRLASANANNLRTILLTHHQLFSAFWEV
jgi:hypothetical protein